MTQLKNMQSNSSRHRRHNKLKPSAKAAERSHAAEQASKNMPLSIPRRLLDLLSGYPAAIALVVIYWVMAVTSITNKSATSDEIVHLPAGYAYWTFNDYRMNPENGNLAQRWMAIPLVLGDFNFPSTNHPYWRQSQEWGVGRDFFFRIGNDTSAILLRGRSMIALLGAVLGLLVYAWSRKIFGPIGGMVSLIIFAFDPSMLANGRLATSDMTAALFFTLSAGTFWHCLHKCSPVSLAASCLAMAGLFLAKMSGVLAIPIGLILITIRLVRNQPLIVKFRGSHKLTKWRPQALACIGITAVHALVVIVLIWTAFGFRYSMFADNHPANRPPDPWEQLTEDKGIVSSSLLMARDHKLLPEGYLYGFAHVYRYSRRRSAFLMGDYSMYGWPEFFPFCFAVKTPLFTMAVIALAALASLKSKDDKSVPIWARLGAALYRTAPLWVLLAVYWPFSINSHLNIGHRHILPVYPATYILAGAAGYWLICRIRRMGVITALLLCGIMVESLVIWPDYLAYFNQSVGGPRKGYKYLVDSSLDWGQDLPSLKKWIDRNTGPDDRVYLSYFGNNIVQNYDVRATRLAGYPEWGRTNSAPAMLPGVYCISATMLQTVLIKPWGPWTSKHERAYNGILQQIPQLKDTMSDPAARDRFVQSINDQAVADTVRLFDQLQFARLAALLRQREPDDYVGWSILVYRLDASDIRRALSGPAPEMKATPYQKPR